MEIIELVRPEYGNIEEFTSLMVFDIADWHTSIDWSTECIGGVLPCDTLNVLYAYKIVDRVGMEVHETVILSKDKLIVNGHVLRGVNYGQIYLLQTKMYAANMTTYIARDITDTYILLASGDMYADNDPIEDTFSITLLNKMVQKLKAYRFDVAGDAIAGVEAFVKTNSMLLSTEVTIPFEDYIGMYANIDELVSELLYHSTFGSTQLNDYLTSTFIEHNVSTPAGFAYNARVGTNEGIFDEAIVSTINRVRLADMKVNDSTLVNPHLVNSTNTDMIHACFALSRLFADMGATDIQLKARPDIMGPDGTFYIEPAYLANLSTGRIFNRGNTNPTAMATLVNADAVSGALNELIWCVMKFDDHHLISEVTIDKNSDEIIKIEFTFTDDEPSLVLYIDIIATQILTPMGI